jgi:hypothetical protein
MATANAEWLVSGKGSWRRSLAIGVSPSRLTCARSCMLAWLSACFSSAGTPGRIGQPVQIGGSGGLVGSARRFHRPTGIQQRAQSSLMERTDQDEVGVVAGETGNAYHLAERIGGGRDGERGDATEPVEDDPAARQSEHQPVDLAGLPRSMLA